MLNNDIFYVKINSEHLQSFKFTKKMLISLETAKKKQLPETHVMLHKNKILPLFHSHALRGQTFLHPKKDCRHLTSLKMKKNLQVIVKTIIKETCNKNKQHCYLMVTTH